MFDCLKVEASVYRMSILFSSLNVGLAVLVIFFLVLTGEILLTRDRTKPTRKTESV